MTAASFAQSDRSRPERSATEPSTGLAFLSARASRERSVTGSPLAMSPKMGELWLNLGDGVNQAANLISSVTSIPSLNFTPLMTFGN